MMTESEYIVARAICDKANAYADSIMRPNGKYLRNWISADEAKNPDYANCTNELRGKVDQFELLRDMPEKFGAYLSSDEKAVTVWTGLPLGRVTCITGRWNRGQMVSFRANIAGVEYIGRGQGAGMYCSMRKAK